MDIAVLWFDTGAVADALAPQIDLAPLNSGNFTQGGARARRGSWLYVPLTAGCEAFRSNRQVRGFVKSPDPLREVSLRGGIGPDALADLVLERAAHLAPAR